MSVALPLPTGQPPLRFIVLTCRDGTTDWTRSLAEAFGERYETWYIWLKRRPQVTRPEKDAEPTEISFFAFVALLRRVTTRDAKNIYFNSTETSFPLTIVLLRFLCGQGIWCLDMYDDLLYDATGLDRLRRSISVKIQAFASDVIVRAADALKELFPRSFHYGNASHILPTPRSSMNYTRILVMASFDRRFDFDFTGDVARAAPAATFHLYGQILQGDPEIAAQLAALRADNPNVIYHGAYSHDDMADILSSYSVSFAPYRVNARLTRYIDPLRYYACLNSGMEMLTTRIPQAERLAEALHIVDVAADAASILENLARSADARRNTPARYTPQTWRQRADLLIGMFQRRAA